MGCRGSHGTSAHMRASAVGAPRSRASQLRALQCQVHISVRCAIQAAVRARRPIHCDRRRPAEHIPCRKCSRGASHTAAAISAHTPRATAAESQHSEEREVIAATLHRASSSRIQTGVDNLRHRKRADAQGPRGWASRLRIRSDRVPDVPRLSVLSSHMVAAIAVNPAHQAQNKKISTNHGADTKRRTHDDCLHNGCGAAAGQTLA